jgi:hypothetical protein
MGRPFDPLFELTMEYPMTCFSGGPLVGERRAIAMTSSAAIGASSGHEIGPGINLGGDRLWH